MITERQEELASLHSLGLLEGAERHAFEAEMTTNRELLAYYDALLESAALIALAAPQVEPPASLRMAVLASIEEKSPDNVVLFSPAGFAPWALAAALAVAAIWFGKDNLALREEAGALRTERQLAEIAYQTTQNQLKERTLLAENMINSLSEKLRSSEDLARLKITALASLAGNTKEAQVIAVWDPVQQSGMLTMEKLPAIADTQDYQIWIVDPAYPDPVNGGVFHVSAAGHIEVAFKPDQPILQATAFAVSLEKKGGVAKADGTIVLLGK